jgi:hypothetical protein
MSILHQRFAPIGEYTPLHINSAGTLVPVGQCVSTTSNTTITAGRNVSVLPFSLIGMYPGQRLNINSDAQAEDIVINSINPGNGTFTADFQYNHSGAYTIISRTGTDLGNIVVNSPGSGCTLTLYNGHPSLYPDVGTVIAVVNPSVTTPLSYFCSCDRGLFYSLSITADGSPCDITLMYVDQRG